MIVMKIIAMTIGTIIYNATLPDEKRLFNRLKKNLGLFEGHRRRHSNERLDKSTDDDKGVEASSN